MGRKLAIFTGKPLFDEPLHVGRPNLPDRKTFDGFVDWMFENRWFTNSGPLVNLFQARLQEKLRVRHCIPMCNGTIALELAYRAVGFKGEVIVPSFTFIATAHALQWQEITPVFCDMKPDDFTIDPAHAETLITARTSGIVGVHTYGNPCDHAALEAIARKHGLEIVYDAAHAFGNEVGGECICRLGRASVLSFHATKFFHSFEGGAIATDDDDLAERLRLMMNFGFAGREKDRVDYIGTNGKMTEICAAMGLAMLERMDDIRRINHANFDAYADAVRGIPGISIVPASPALTRSNRQYVVLTVDEEAFGLSRDGLVSVLEAENVLARRYFHPGCHHMLPYSGQFPNKGRKLPVTEKLSERVLVLPTGEAVDGTAARFIAMIISKAHDSAGDIRKLWERGRNG